jgi:short-subunit dehydrogenase
MMENQSAFAASYRLAGAVAVITGGSSGLGLASGKVLAELGAHVLLVARNAQRLEAAAQQITSAGYSASWFAADTGIPDACAEVADRAAELGQVKVLVNSAGI